MGDGRPTYRLEDKIMTAYATNTTPERSALGLGSFVTFVMGVLSLFGAFYLAFYVYDNPLTIPVMALWTVGMICMRSFIVSVPGAISVLIYLAMYALGLFGLLMVIPWIIGMSMAASGGVFGGMFLPALLWLPVFFGLPGVLAYTVGRD